MTRIQLWDVDETLCKEVCYDEKDCRKATPIQENIEKLNKIFDAGNGCFIIIYTARKLSLAQVTIDWLDKHHVKYHAISFRKIPGEMYVDVNAKKPKDL